jgi:hypothetical protein
MVLKVAARMMKTTPMIILSILHPARRGHPDFPALQNRVNIAKVPKGCQPIFSLADSMQGEGGQGGFPLLSSARYVIHFYSNQRSFEQEGDRPPYAGLHS